MTDERNTLSAETFNIPPANLAKLNERIAKLNKRAEKIGVEPIKVEVGDRQTEEIPVEEGGHGRSPHGTRSALVREVVPVTITGEAPKLNGWQFIATLEHDEDGTIIRRIPTFAKDVDLSQYRDATPENCDHCGYKRKRNDTYIVAYTGEGLAGSGQVAPTKIDGTLKQVGSNCLKDFTGHESPQQVAKFLEQVRNFLEEMRGGGYSEGGFVPRYSVREFLANTVWVARNFGWVSKKQAWEDGKTATAVTAGYITQKVPNFELGSEAPLALTDSDYAWADKIIEWAENVEVPEDGDDYLHNVVTVIKGGTLTARQFGIAASATQAYKHARRDEHVGTVGERIEITFTVERVFDNEAYKTLVLRDKLGRSFKWMTNVEIDPAKTYRGSFKVKSHDTHERYGKQTYINYPRDLEEIA